VSRPAFLCVLALTVVLACHQQQGTTASVRNVITQDQIDSTGYTNVYDVIARLHAEYLRDRGAVSIKTNQHARAVVFLNAQEYGIPETLRNFPAGGVSEIRYYRGPDAVSKFGSQYGGGVIQLISRNR
jgi:outer membrane receptor for ferrienterochelin and colicin